MHECYLPVGIRDFVDRPTLTGWRKLHQLSGLPDLSGIPAKAEHHNEFGWTRKKSEKTRRAPARDVTTALRNADSGPSDLVQRYVLL